MTLRLLKPFALFAICILIVGMACSMFGSSSEETAEPAVETEAPITMETEAPVSVETEAPMENLGGDVVGIDNIQNAVIQIESQGTFADPQFGEYLGAGRGSGFIIDPSGLAVTNNHVVAGAGLLKVWIGGDPNVEYNARVIAVSECSDLAVIDIEGDDFPYLSWYDGSISVGMDMYLAGFPLGDPQFSLTKGIVSKSNASGESSRSAVDSVIEYDATSNPGNSGGPVVSTDGEVLAVHYMANTSARQAFGISKNIAKSVVETLKTGENVDSIGVNGEAVSNEDGSIKGVWVYSVVPGSAADKSGVLPGDIITQLGDIPVASDGTMAEYCTIVRSHSETETMPIEILRLSSGELLEGQLNGRELAVTNTFDVSGSTESGGDGQQGTAGTVPGTTLNANASSPGEFYYSTEFDDVSDWEYLVVQGNENGFSQEANNSKFRVKILKGNTWVYFLNKNFTYEDVQLDTRVENLGQNTNYTGLFCRMSEDGWYEANILNTGEYAIYLYDPNNGGLKTLHTGGSNLINMGKDVNEYTFVCQGDELVLGINGYEVIRLTTKIGGAWAILREGQAGVFVASTYVFPLLVEFDWFTASVPY
ncbi:MAG: serine protease [Anaerolineales bacterium]|nr:serine protease [Anaerolineales bacterium]